MDSHYRPAPFPHDDALIHGHGIELAPTKPSYQEHHSQPGLEVATHSTLELAKSSPASHLHQKEHLLPHPGAVFDPSKLGWAEPNSKPSSIYRQSTTPSVGTTARGYLLLCGRDYNSNVGTTQDMYHTPTDTLSECLDACAQQDGCVGAGWGSGNVGGVNWGR
ncbi:hypothetical protein N0V88_001735 [Collariella sp. IMI 366227]|nr:hypothetical protein N0V88_001735 [Collariella sp. IMI 366227]